ncbi:67cd7b42-03de-4411-a86b-92c88f607708 [Thermothielavioides terrestris]|uniref:67cd7b42-03de-4411-a86b-92c88f607708 n=1 Tax=Thermothielavioides terrestris TaxID=2587410 RepID=A0A446BAF3_9PEZI|nr:67cd7b42-03de-4411-a86b-92c88f607708 [Thermothielavioides terrestris]
MVRIARVRYDHDGRRIAFVEFHRRSDAEHFYDRYYPEISFPLEHSRGLDSEPVTVGVSFPNNDETHSSRESRRDDDGWDCIQCGAMNYPHRAVCYKCKAERPDDHDASGPFLTGETDECPQQTPSQYVVVRDLEGSVTEEVLAKGVMKLFVENPEPAKEAPTTTNKLKSTAPTNSTAGLGAKPGSLRRVFLMRDRKTNESWRYGFAEFATVDDARAAVAKFRASTKFTIASKPVVVAFIHTGVFVPAFDAPATENQEFSFTPIYNPAVRVKYWDERAYPSAHVVSTDPLPGAPSPDKPVGDGEAAKPGAKPSKKAKSTKESATAPKIAMIPQMQLWAKASAELHGAKSAEDENVPSMQEPDEVRPGAARPARAASREVEEAEADGPVAAQWGDQYLSYADWNALTCLACGWEAPSQAHIDERGWPQSRSDLLIEHEGRAHDFFRDDTEAKSKAVAALTALGRDPRLVVRRTPRLKSDRLPVYKSYADFDRLRCVLCRRVFKHVRLLWLHEQQSALHKRMLANPQNRARAAAEFKKAGAKMRVLEPDPAFRRRWEAQRARVVAQQGQPQAQLYRDRALERRKAFGQPKQPATTTSSGAAATAAGTTTATTAATAPAKRKDAPREDAEAEKEQQQQRAAKKSKGADMLAKMGWTEGAGLGAEGAGRTEAIATEVYAPGVGLGAEGGRLGDAAEEAARNTRGGFAAFVEKTRERARERFEKMAGS